MRQRKTKAHNKGVARFFHVKKLLSFENFYSSVIEMLYKRFLCEEDFVHEHTMKVGAYICMRFKVCEDLWSLRARLRGVDNLVTQVAPFQ